MLSNMTMLDEILSYRGLAADLGPRDYAAAVEAVRDAIARGDVYQVNLVQHLSAPFAGEPARSPPPRAA